MCGRWERKYNISHFLLYWSGLGDSSDEILKRSFSALTSLNAPWLHSLHPLLSVPALIQYVPGQRGHTIWCIFVDFLRPLIKLSNKWSHDVTDWRDASNKKTKLSTTARAITKSLHPGKQFKYLPTLVKQSGIILYCYNTEKRLSYFPYFLLIPWGWKQGGGSD